MKKWILLDLRKKRKMIKFEKVNYTYQPNSPFASRALFDIDLEVKKEVIRL